jgi:hypothetical protein
MDKALEVLSKLHDGHRRNFVSVGKELCAGQFPSRYETSGQLSGLLTQMFWYGFDESFINNFQKCR